MPTRPGLSPQIGDAGPSAGDGAPSCGFPLPPDDRRRAAALGRYGPERETEAEVFAGLARTAALALNAPLALVTFVGAEMIYVAGQAGGAFQDLPRELSFCTFGICGDGPFVVEDARTDPRFADNPFVVGPPGIRAYAGSPIRTPDGHAIGMVCALDTNPRGFRPEAVEVLGALSRSVMDALEARRAARLHERMATEYQALFRTHPQPMWVFDDKTLRILTVNDAALDAYGYTREEMLALTILDLRPEAELEAVREALADTSGTSYRTGPWTHRRKDGTLFPVTIEARPVAFRGRKARLARLTDASDVVRAEDALHASEALTRSALTALDDLFFVGDPEGRLLRGNPKAFEATGYTEDEFLGLSVADFFAGEDLERAHAAYRRAFTDGTARVQADLVTKEGRRIPYEFTGAVVRDRTGRPVGVTGIGRDISRWREVEAIRASNLDVLKAVVRGEPLPDVLARIVRLLEVRLPGSRCAVLLYDAEAGVLRHGAAPSLPDAYNRLIDGIAVGPTVGSCGTAAYRNAPVFVEDVSESPLWAQYLDLVRPYGLRACWSTPIRGGDGVVLGTVAVYYDEPRASSEEDAPLIELLVGLAAIAIEHHRQQQELRQRDRLLRALADAMLALLTEPELDAGVARALRAVGEAAGADRAYLFEHHREPETGTLLASQRAEWARDGVAPQFDNAVLQEFRQEEYLPEWTEAILRGEPASACVSELAGPVREIMEAQDIRSFLLVPVFVGGEVWGFVGLDDCTGGREWAEAQRATLRVAGAALGAAYTRARAEAALRQANDRFEAVSANAPGVVFEAIVEPDLSTSYPYVSASGPRTFGADLSKLMDDPSYLARLVHPEDLESLQASIVEAVAGRDAWAWEGRIINDAGEVRWAAGASRLVAATPDGQTRWHGLFLDITARRIAENALRESEERFRTLFNVIGEGFCIVELVYDASGRAVDHIYLEANPAFCAHTGIAEHPVGRTAREIIPDVEPAWFERYGQVVETGEPVQFEMESPALGRWFDVGVFPLGEAGGRRLALLFSDITDRKLHEYRLREARDAAEVARSAAEEADRLKTALLTNMSHEFRTPLTGIIGFADLLASELAEEQREMAIHIARNGHRLQETLSAVLTLAQLESGTFQLYAAPTPLAEAARTVAGGLSELAAERGLELRCALPGEEVPVLADAAALRRVATSLLTNAVKFTESGWIEVEVRRGEGVGELLVRDTGVGIGAAFRPHLFKEFAQESVGLDRRFEGSGLGLAVTYRLVRAMGGEIEVESERGQGTTFTVRLPLA